MAFCEGIAAKAVATMISMPMPTDFAIRLAGGLASMLLLTSWNQVPPAFFRTICLVLLGAFVAGALTAMGAVPTGVLVAIVIGAVLSYLASAFWGLGLPRVAVPLTASILGVSAGLILWESLAGRPLTFLNGFNAASRLSSAGLLGATLAAMLLGHHYLTAPAMSIDPLKRYVAAMAWTLPPRTLLAAIGLFLIYQSGSSRDAASPMFLGMRWGMGVLGPAVATYLSWQTVRIRSTQSATGILYIGITLVLFGELAGLILGRSAGVEL